MMEHVDYETLFKDRYDKEADIGYIHNKNKNCHRFQPYVQSWLRHRRQGMNKQYHFNADRMRDRREAPYDRREAPYGHRGAPYDHRGAPYDRRGASYDRRDAPYDRRDAPYDHSKRENAEDKRSNADESNDRSRRPKKVWRGSQNHQKETESVILKDKEALKEAIKRYQKK